MKDRKFHVSCYNTPGNTHQAAETYTAKAAYDVAVYFSAEHLGGTQICDGRMETGGVSRLWSFAAIGFGQRVWVQEID